MWSIAQNDAFNSVCEFVTELIRLPLNDTNTHPRRRRLEIVIGSHLVTVLQCLLRKALTRGFSLFNCLVSECTGKENNKTISLSSNRNAINCFMQFGRKS